MSTQDNSLHDIIKSYLATSPLPMHMPGHKRNAKFGDAPDLDITEVDMILHGEGQAALAEMCKMAAELYGAAQALPSVGGSTCAILAAVYATTRPGDSIIMARNCHKSVYHAAEICRLDVSYLLPEFCPTLGVATHVPAQAVEVAFAQSPNARLVVITSPTYEGIVSDIVAIARIVRRHEALLFVDSAHGAHFLGGDFSSNAIAQGADLAVVSLHKTLPALTPSAFLLCGERISVPNRVEIERAMGMFGTSSPSYPLLASMDNCIRLMTDRGAELLAKLEQNLHEFFQRVANMQNLALMPNDDPSKLVICGKSVPICGSKLMSLLLHEYNVELEMAGVHYALAMTTVADERETLIRFADALVEIDSLHFDQLTTPQFAAVTPTLPEVALPAWQARTCEGEVVPFDSAGGRISLEYAWAYPPGIPVLVPGEVVPLDFADEIEKLRVTGVRITTSSGSDYEIRVKS